MQQSEKCYPIFFFVVVPNGTLANSGIAVLSHGKLALKLYRSYGSKLSEKRFAIPDPFRKKLQQWQKWKWEGCLSILYS